MCGLTTKTEAIFVQASLAAFLTESTASLAACFTSSKIPGSIDLFVVYNKYPDVDLTNKKYFIKETVKTG
uniref:Uncharacterized protein n=1 Tax=Romanomermis culicivorax TaxID=13658 RepID=A0A915JL81_ROMCU